jgi:hypothetical protein
MRLFSPLNNIINAATQNKTRLIGTFALYVVLTEALKAYAQSPQDQLCDEICNRSQAINSVNALLQSGQYCLQDFLNNFSPLLLILGAKQDSLNAAFIMNTLSSIANYCRENVTNTDMSCFGYASDNQVATTLATLIFESGTNAVTNFCRK